MAKSADAFRSIGEVARLIGVAPHVLRYWETQFPQLAPVKRADGRRYYRPDDVRLAAGLCEVMRDDGMTARGALRLMAEDRGAALRARGAERVRVLLEAEAGPSPASPGSAAARRKAAVKPVEMPLFGDGLVLDGASEVPAGIADAHGEAPTAMVAAVQTTPPLTDATASPDPRPVQVRAQTTPSDPILARLTALADRIRALPATERPDLREAAAALRTFADRVR